MLDIDFLGGTMVTFQLEEPTDSTKVRQILDDPEEHHDWAITAEVDLAAIVAALGVPDDAVLDHRVLDNGPGWRVVLLDFGLVKELGMTSVSSRARSPSSPPGSVKWSASARGRSGSNPSPPPPVPTGPRSRRS